MIQDNIADINMNINKACTKANRDIHEVTLIAVSKTKPVSSLMEAYNCGCREFGENKVQELIAKYETMPKDIRWHMIGHLQRNKVKYIIDKVALIHSVDSLKLAEEIRAHVNQIEFEKKIRQEFFSNASHELKTPITSVKGYAELLDQGFVKDEATKKDFIARILKETDNMTNLINDSFTSESG